MAKYMLSDIKDHISRMKESTIRVEGYANKIEQEVEQNRKDISLILLAMEKVPPVLPLLECL